VVRRSRPLPSLNKLCLPVHDRVDGDSAQQKLAGNSAIYIFPLCVLSFFFSLRAFESWSLPLAIILIVPMCLFSSIYGVWLLDGENIFTQIGFIVLVGWLVERILIVEFAKQIQDRDQKTASPLQSKRVVSDCADLDDFIRVHLRCRSSSLVRVPARKCGRPRHRGLLRNARVTALVFSYTVFTS